MANKYFMLHPKAHAINALAKRFDLPNEPSMQDWEYEVADAQRINEFLIAYTEKTTSEDEKFVLMEMLIESFSDSNRELTTDQD